jgi:hypothetical protein
MTAPNVSRTLTPGPYDKLADLAAAYEVARAEADAATERLTAARDALKAEMLRGLPPGVRTIDLAGAVPLRLAYVESTRLDSKRLKAEHPEVWKHYAKTSAAWRLKAVAP